MMINIRDKSYFLDGRTRSACAEEYEEILRELAEVVSSSTRNPSRQELTSSNSNKIRVMIDIGAHIKQEAW